MVDILPTHQWPYQTTPYDRATADIEFVDPAGTRATKHMLIDTGCPFEILIEETTALSMNFGIAPHRITTNFGIMDGYNMKVEVASLGYSRRILCWSNRKLGSVLSAEGFDGMIGLVVLKSFISYRGDKSGFALEF